jgi:hypothetical protein
MRVLACVAAAAALFGGAAHAAVVVVTMTGTVTTQTTAGPNTDPHIKVGDTLTLTATFDSSTLINWGSSGYQIASVYSNHLTGTPLLTISGPDGLWYGINDVQDGHTAAYTLNANYYQPDGTHVVNSLQIGQPVIILNGSHAAGITGDLVPTGTSTIPILNLGYISPGSETITGGLGSPISDQTNFPTLTPNPGFTILAGGFEYGNTTPSPGFSGVWDFADSTVTTLGVPEPAAWALMILGVGLAGGALRRQRRIAAPAA